MTTYIERLSEDIKIKVAGTGTIYLEFNEKTIRIGNHLPNYSMIKFRGDADLKLYTHDIEGKEILTKWEVLERIATFFEIAIPSRLQASITRGKNLKSKKAAIQAALDAESEKQRKAFIETRKSHMDVIKKLVTGREQEVREMLKAAQAYGELGSNAEKKRKRRTSYFKREFLAAFGMEAAIQDVKTVMDIKWSIQN